MESYCNYHNAEWCKRITELKSTFYKIKIEGNTLYIVHKPPVYAPVYKKIFGKIYIRLNDRGNKHEPAQCTIFMCKLKESTLVDMLKSYGFEVAEIDGEQRK